MTTPNPSEVSPWYLRNITQALALDETSGNVYIRTGFEGNIIISGNVNVPGNIDAHISEIGTSGNLTVPYMPIAGNITIDPGQTVEVTQGTDPWNITGNVNAAVTGTVTANQGTNPWVVSGNVGVTGTSNVALGGNNLDAFGRLRISDPYTLFDSALSGNRRYDFSTTTTGSGNVTFDYNANVRKLNVTSSSGDEVIRESMYCFPYQPGKSLLVMNSFIMATAKTGLRQRIGYFTTNNGIYFEQTGTTKNMVIRSYSSGALTEERIPQASWNGDKLNGTGPSGLTLNTAATQIFWNDIEWLGVGTVRVGFVINGQFITCHSFNHANDPTFATTYMGTATLPVRCEITNTGSTAGNSTMQQICSTVISEGGYNNAYFTYTAGTDINPKRLTTAGTYYPIASFRLQSGYLNSIVRLAQVDILSPTVNYYRWSILKNATLTGATWASSSSTTRVQADTAATAVSNGTEIQSGYASSRELTQLTSNFYGQLGRTLAGASDILTLALTATSNNADVLAQVGWQEIL